MTALLTNRSVQVFVIVLAALAAVSTLLATGTLDKTTGTNLLYGVISFALGVPLTVPSEAPAPPSAASTAPAGRPAPAPTQAQSLP